ncbi:RUS family member 1-like [Aphidius gifuensis]|uniref:RUS family member 1-like n=1 Tax=Aphidius gifuensis TaxID=684658 RepID=UPI001CDD7CA6|nr:RUS family member 1-like [Aphidius gifuensis]
MSSTKKFDQQSFFQEIYSDSKQENVIFKSDKKMISESSHTSIWNTLASIHNIKSTLKEIFLPEGFPHSVHPDYVAYQIWDTVQAFASTILGNLTTYSILESVGVGNTNKTPLAATIAWILKDGTGMIGRIVFSWQTGTQLDSQCKKWRLFADVLNDLAMGLELMLLYYATSYTTIILCLSTSMKAVVSVAGGATRAALTQHQALNNNICDVSAKDGSQETLVNLVASTFGIFLLSVIPSTYFMFLYILFVTLHIYANYSAIRALRLSSLNEDRLALILDRYIDESHLASVDEINQKESLFFGGQLTKQMCGFEISIGASLASIFKNKKSNHLESEYFEEIVYRFRDEKYLIYPVIEDKKIYIALRKDAQYLDILKAFFTSYYYGLIISAQLGNEKMIYKLTVNKLGPRTITYNQMYDKKYWAAGNKNNLALQTMKHFDSIINKDFESWYELLQKSDWKHEVNHLPVAGWRANWQT